MTRLLALAALAALTGCLGPAEFRGWQEPPHLFAQCHGAPNGVAACFDEAHRLCPQGYQLAELRSDPDINRHSIIVVCGVAPRSAEPAPAPPARTPAPPAATPPK